jgi:DNA-binding GntR family transcriptional regulator
MTSSTGELKFISLADSVFEKIEGNILSGKYKKGETFTESKLSQLFGVSRTPIREAIRKLEQEDLIRITTKGIEIKGISASDIEDIYEIRSRIEGLAAKKCAGIITEEGLEQLKEIIDLQEFYTQKGLSEKVRDTDSAFHESIYSICGSGIYLSVLKNLHRRIKKYRKLSIQRPERAKKAVLEHREIYDALSKHDGELAEKLTAMHIDNARSNIMQNFNELSQGDS